MRSLGTRRAWLGQRASVPARHISGSPAMSPRRPRSNLAGTGISRNPGVLAMNIETKGRPVSNSLQLRRHPKLFPVAPRRNTLDPDECVGHVALVVKPGTRGDARKAMA